MRKKLLILFLFISVLVPAQSDKVFISNDGQWDEKIVYNKILADGNLFLEKDGFTYSLYEKSYIQKLVKDEPTIAYNIISKLGKDLGAAEYRLTSFSQKNVRERLAELLLVLQESYGEKVDNKTKLNIKLTREEMASIIGTASETLIRFFTEFKNENIIEQEGKTIFIIDEEKLIDFANISY